MTAWAVDQGVKMWAVSALEGEPPIELIGSLLRLNLVYNPGAAFGAGAQLTPFITVFAILACAVALWFVARVRHRGWAVALGLLVAGVAGNLTDRLLRDPGPFRGHVVDMFELPRWPVFNVADICIDVAAVLLVILVMRGVGVDGTRHNEADERAS